MRMVRWLQLSGVLLWCLASLSHAATIAWSGAASNANFNNGNNWSGGSAPGSSDIASFGDVTNQSVNVNGNRTIDSVLFSAPDTYTLSGSTLTISNGVTQTGGGTVLITNTVQLGNSQTWNIGAGSTMTVTGTINANWGLTFTKDGDGLLVLSGSNWFPQGVTVADGTLRLTSSQAMGTSSSWNNVVSSGATLELSGGINVTQGSISMAGSGYNGNGALLSTNGVNSISAQISLTGDTTFKADTGSTLNVLGSVSSSGSGLTLAGSGNIIMSTFNGGALTITGAGNRTFSSGVYNSNYTTTINSDGSSYFGGALSTKGLTVSGNGSLTVSGQFTSASQAAVFSNNGFNYFGQSFDAYGLTTSGSNSMTVVGQLNLHDNAMVLGNSGTNTFSGPAYNVGGLTITNSTNIFSQALGLTNNGSVYIDSAGAQTFSGTLTTYNFTSTGSGSVYVGSSVYMSTGAMLLQNTGGNLFAGQVNVGSLTITGSGNNVFNNSIQAGTGAITINSSGNQTVSGQIAAGSYTMSGSGTTTLIGGGTINVTNGLNVNGGTLILAKSSTDAVQSSIVINNATVRLAGNEQIQQSNNVNVWVQEGGLFDLNNYNESIDMVKMTGGTVTTGTGTLTISNTGGTNVITYASSNSSVITGHLAFAGPSPIVQVADGAAAIDLNVNATIYAANGFTKTGAGVMQVDQTVTSGGPVEINQGTLLLGASNIIANNVQIKLTGGTFATGGYSDTVGNLTLTANSTINMGSGNSILTFDSATYTGGTLTVTNWSGNAGGGGTDQIHFTTTPSATFLANVYWADYGTYGAKMIGNEMVPLSGVPIVPEPGTVAGGLLLLSFLLWRTRSRWWPLLRRQKPELSGG